ncbi:MAG: diguanylate cyclase, partial [Candidatus Eremiobacteraeota bacterium]|nr:diguanylate cyclase [Candidatus Eremiobacteraeota bacterium]
MGITLIAAVLLLIALWRANSLSVNAAGDTTGLYREQQGLAFERRLFPLYLDLQRYRLAYGLLAGAPSASRIARDISRQLNDPEMSQLAVLNDVPDEWRKIRRDWAALNATHPTVDTIAKFLKTYYDVFQKVADNSGISYDGQRYGQDLGAELFNTTTTAANELLQGEFVVNNAQSREQIALKPRLRLSVLVSGAAASFDPTIDDIDGVYNDYARRFPNKVNDVVRYKEDLAALAKTGATFKSRTTALVLERETPTGNPANTRTFTERALGTLIQYHQDLSSVFQAELVQRAATLRERNLSLYIAAVLACILIVGLMLWIAQTVIRRDRRQLEDAQTESARLSAELARQKAERALRLSEAQFRAVFDGAAIGIAILDRNGNVLDSNAVFRQVYGTKSAGVLEGHEDEFAALMRKQRDLFEFEQHVMTPEGHEAWTDTTVSLVTDDAGFALFAMCMFRDLTELKRNERRRLHDMTHDVLTGLANRQLFESALREEFVRSDRAATDRFAVFFVDLDRFKDINDSLGHDSGDFVLSHVAQRLRAQLEPGDMLARLGSDEFAVLAHSAGDAASIEALARRMLSALSKPISVGDRSIFITASVGVAPSLPQYERAEDIMRDADIAMRHAKAVGGSRFASFDAEMHGRAEKRLQLTTDLRLAIERGEFTMVYQPIVRVADGEPAGCEALIRWNHPVEGTVMPSTFLPIAEQTGLAIPIGRFVLDSVCEQLSSWKAHGRVGCDFAMNVNVSAAELLDADFETMLLETIAKHDISPEELTLEITESVVLDCGTESNAIVERLREHGFKVCIDDFGTGYSS